MEGARITLSGLLNTSFTPPSAGFIQQLFTITVDGNSAIGSISDTFVFNDGPNDVVYALNVYRLSAVTLDGFNTFQELLLAGSSLTSVPFLFSTTPKHRKGI